MAEQAFASGENGNVTLIGEWRAKTVNEQWEALLALPAINSIDLHQVTQIDSAGLAAIITALIIKNGPKALDIRHCPESIQPLLALYGLDLHIADND